MGYVTVVSDLQTVLSLCLSPMEGEGPHLPHHQPLRGSALRFGVVFMQQKLTETLSLLLLVTFGLFSMSA